MEKSSRRTVQFLENKAILVTGAAGFLAKIFVEKILRVQPNVKKLYLLVRAPDNEAAMQRFRDEAIEKDLFRVLRNNLGEDMNSFMLEKVKAVAGDISMEDLGIKDLSLRQQMWTDIDAIVNVAATTNFDERYDVALGINAMGAFNVLNFGKKCVKLQMLLHVSTCYVWGERSGLLAEKPFAMGETLNGSKLVIDTEMNLVKQKLDELKAQDSTEKETAQALKDLGMNRAKVHGWPNTYVFTKAMGEMLVGHYRETLPIIILRPTMITSTFQHPFPGWIEGLRTIDSVIVEYGKGRLKCFLGDPQAVFDLIPADMVVNAMVVAMAGVDERNGGRGGGDGGDMRIYQVGSSCRNPVVLDQIHDIAVRYFGKNPLLARNGTPIRVRQATILPSVTRFSLYLTLRYKFPLQILRLFTIIYPWRYGETYEDLNRKLKLVMKLVDLYKPYVLFKGIFDDTNTEKLRYEALKQNAESDKAFGFDPMTIDWDVYMMKTHIPGLTKYVLKR